MHVPDGFLAPVITLPAYAIAAPLWIWSVRRHFGANQVETLPAVGALTAVAFVLQTIHIPVPGGTSTHLLGISLLALLGGPWVAFVCETLVLVLQALFFGAGGITALGVNALAMGLLGPVVAWLLASALRRTPGLGAFIAGYIGMQVSTAAIVTVLALQHALSPTHFPTPWQVAATTMMIPSLTVAGIIEGLYTAFAYRLLRRMHVRVGP